MDVIESNNDINKRQRWYPSISSSLPPSTTLNGVGIFLCLSLLCPSLAPTIPAPRLPASLHPSLPSPSLAAPLWLLGSAASASPAVCSLASTCSLSQTQHSLPSGLRGGEGEGKHFKLRPQPRKRGSADSRAPLKAVGIRMFTDIYRFVSLELKYARRVYTLSLLSHPLIHSK